MNKKFVQKIFLILISVILCQTTTIGSVCAIVSGEDAYNQDAQEYLDHVNELLEERNFALLNNNDSLINEKENELLQLGVEKISQADALKIISKEDPEAV